MRVSVLDRRNPQRGDQRRAALLRALDGLLQDSPLDSINIADISARAGVSRSAFYFYFENKSAAVAALVSDMYDEAFAAAGHLAAELQSPRERIEATIRGLFGAFDGNEYVYRAMHAARQSSQAVRELWDADRASFVEPVAVMIEAERAAGNAPDGPAATTLATVLLELNDQAIERLVLGSNIDREERAQALVTIWLRTIYGRTDDEKPRKRRPAR